MRIKNKIKKKKTQSQSQQKNGKKKTKKKRKLKALLKNDFGQILSLDAEYLKENLSRAPLFENILINIFFFYLNFVFLDKLY